MAPRSHEEQCYADLADELNDGDVEWREDDWQPWLVNGARAYALDRGLAWPPEEGDYDRYYEQLRS